MHFDREMMSPMPNPSSIAILSAALSNHAFWGSVRGMLTVSGSIASRTGAGGTAPERVAEQLTALTRRVRTLMEAWQ
jgi:argininosuccinate lyase